MILLYSSPGVRPSGHTSRSTACPYCLQAPTSSLFELWCWICNWKPRSTSNRTRITRFSYNGHTDNKMILRSHLAEHSVSIMFTSTATKSIWTLTWNLKFLMCLNYYLLVVLLLWIAKSPNSTFCLCSPVHYTESSPLFTHRMLGPIVWKPRSTPNRACITGFSSNCPTLECVLALHSQIINDRSCNGKISIRASLLTPLGPQLFTVL
jgi:hypothetical protein